MASSKETGYSMIPPQAMGLQFPHARQESQQPHEDVVPSTVKSIPAYRMPEYAPPQQPIENGTQSLFPQKNGATFGPEFGSITPLHSSSVHGGSDGKNA